MSPKKLYRTHSEFSKRLDRKVTFFFSSTLGDDEPGPLLIMHDGQNLFDDKKAAYGTSWGFLDAMRQPGVPKMRVIGIANAETFEGRCAEYSPFVRRSIKDEGIDFPTGGKGDNYLAYIFEDLLPKLRKHYPITSVYMGGSSLGGLITLAAALKFPNVLDGAFGLSNAFWYAEKPLMRRVETFEGILPRFYMDIGTHESSDPKVNLRYERSHQKFAQALASKSNRGLRNGLIDGGKHFEKDWADRLADVLRWLMT